MGVCCGGDGRRTAQKGQFPCYQSCVLSQLPVLLQLSVSETGQVVAVVVLVGPHRLFSFGPEAVLDAGGVVFCNLKVFVPFQVVVLRERDAVLSLAHRFFDQLRVQLLQIVHELLQLGDGLVRCVGPC